jgi:hypothetical protein
MVEPGTSIGRDGSCVMCVASGQWCRIIQPRTGWTPRVQSSPHVAGTAKRPTAIFDSVANITAGWCHARPCTRETHLR